MTIHTTEVKQLTVMDFLVLLGIIGVREND